MNLVEFSQMLIRSCGNISHSNHVLIGIRCRLVVRIAYWDLRHIVPLYDNGGTAAREAVEGEENGEEEIKEGKYEDVDVDFCILD